MRRVGLTSQKMAPGLFGFCSSSISESECGRISDLASKPLQGARAEFHRHVGTWREWAFETACVLAGEAEARIVMRMTENDDDALTRLAQDIQTLADQSSTDALMLIFNTAMGANAAAGTGPFPVSMNIRLKRMWPTRRFSNSATRDARTAPSARKLSTKSASSAWPNAAALIECTADRSGVSALSKRTVNSSSERTWPF